MEKENLWLVNPKTQLSHLKLSLNSRVFVFNDTNETLTLDEVYKITQNTEVIKSRFGTWTPSNGMNFEKTPIEERRGNFHGVELKCGSEPDPPFIMTHDNGDGTIELSGVLGIIWDEVEKKLNFT